MGKRTETEIETENYKEEIAAEKERLTALLSDCNIDAKKIKILEPIIENTVWMKIKLDATREKIKTSPAVVKYDNGGGQTGIRENPYYKAYESLFKSYMSGMDKILAYVPKEAAEQAVEVEKPKSVLELVRDKHKKEA